MVADESGFTGGSFDLSNIPGYGLDSLDLVLRPRVCYWIALGVMPASPLVVFLAVRSPLGTGLTALRDNPAGRSVRHRSTPISTRAA
ncbi:hypothetical protein ACWEP4_21690 [Streptomyces sp. NPDC004227]